MTQVLAPVGGGSNAGEAITLADGGFMVVWTHLVTSLLPIPNVADDQFTAVLGRVFNADGTPRGEVFQVNQSDAASGQGQADLALLSNGNVVVVWTDGPNATNFDVAARGRILTATGAAVTEEFELSAVTDRDQRIPQVAANDAGGFFATWSDGRHPWSNTNEQWIGQQFDANGNRIGAELWIRNDSSSEDSELLHLSDGFYALVASNGRLFNSDARFTYSGDIEASTNFTGNATGGGRFSTDAVTDGNGSVAIVVPFNSFSLSVTTSVAQTQINGQNGSFSDGTPFAETITGLVSDPESIAQGGTRLAWIDFGAPGQPDFTPQGVHAPAAAATYMPNGNLAVVWTGVSGGTVNAPEFSVFAQILSAEGIILSDVIVIEDQNVVGTDIFPPFVSAGADGRLFVGWTGTTDRNGAGTNEVMGGVFDIPTYGPGDDIPSFVAGAAPIGTLASDGDDAVTGVAPVDFAPTPALYLQDGNDIWTQGAATQTSGVFGMNGDDRFIVTDPGLLEGLNLRAGLGRDILDLSAATTGFSGFVSVQYNFNSVATAQNQFEVVIGTRFADTFQAPSYVNTFFFLGGPLPEGALLHAEEGDDTIRFSQSSGGIVDGGDGFDVMTTFDNRASYELVFHGTYYTLGFLSVPFGSTAPPAVRPENVLILRGIEEIRFAGETVTLQSTATIASGGIGSAGGLPTDPPIVDNGTQGSDSIPGGAGNDTLSGRAGNDTIAGAGGDDVIAGGIGFDILSGDGGNDTLTGNDGFDSLYGGAGDDVLFGNNGLDSLDGGDGNDTLWGGLGTDTLSGAAGHDQLNGLAGFDRLEGGAGNDTLRGNEGNDTLFGGAGDDQLDGGFGADSLNGDAGNDLLFGGNGGDILLGGDGNDRLEGNAGDDTLDGGLGNDVLRGGNGADVFVFRVGYGQDRIADFQNNIDTVQIDAALLGLAAPVPTDLIAFAGRTTEGFLILDFGNGDTLTFTGVTNTGAILDEVVFI